jgi:hypothetical protein
MPTKSRKERKALRDAYLKMLDQAEKNVPEHLLCRIDSPSTISEKLKKTGGYGWGGYQFEPATGQAIKLKKTDTKQSANAVRRGDREKRIQQLYLRYHSLWGRRAAAKAIAFNARDELGIPITEGTVARYIKNYPNGI